jgi:hypothetical protein
MSSLAAELLDQLLNGFALGLEFGTLLVEFLLLCLYCLGQGFDLLAQCRYFDVSGRLLID